MMMNLIRWSNLSSLLLLALASDHTFRSVASFVLRHNAVHRHSSNRQSTELQARVVVVAGATGYIGRNVVRESVHRDYETVALVRDASQARSSPYLQGCSDIIECDVCNSKSVESVIKSITNRFGKIDSVVSCLASRSGIKSDAYAVDYQASLNLLESARRHKAGHYCLLSAYCVRKPELQFQHAKLKLEAALQAQNEVPYSIVRPTAFFKSVSGQFENIKAGKPIVLFGDGESAPCNPIAESDLANYMLDCMLRRDRLNRILDIGGNGEPVTHKKYNTMMSQALHIQKPQYVHVPVVTFDILIGMFELLHKLTGAVKMENAAEVARIVRYYAVEPMLTTRPEEKYGNVQLADYYQDIAENGQEFDPYVSFYSSPSSSDDYKAALPSKMQPVYNVTMR